MGWAYGESLEVACSFMEKKHKMHVEWLPYVYFVAWENDCEDFWSQIVVRVGSQPSLFDLGEREGNLASPY